MEEFMFDFDKFSVSKFYNAPPEERVVEFTPPGIDVDNIAKVLSLGVDAKCSSAEAFEGYVQVNGRTNFRLTYLDKEKNPKGVDYNVDFSMRIDGEYIAGDNVQCSIKIVESDAQAGDKLTLSAVLEVSALALRREEVEALVSADECYKTIKDINLPSFIATKTVSVPFDDEKSVGGEITSVLSLNTNCAVTAAETMDGGARIRADVQATVTYLEGGEVKQADFTIPMEDELSLDGVMAGDSLQVNCAVKNSKVILQGVTDDNVIRVEGDVQLSLFVFRNTACGVVQDIFMLTHEVSVTRDTSRLTVFDGCKYHDETVSGTAVLGDNRAAIISISAVPYARCFTSRAYLSEDGKLTVEGVVNTDVIYVDENGYNSVRAEIPFSLALDDETSSNVKVECGVKSVSATARREREIDLDVRLAISVCSYSDAECEYISAVELGEEKPQNRSALSVYIASDGDDLLQLCKVFTAMPEDITAQNPALEFPLKEGDRAIYFRFAKV